MRTVHILEIPHQYPIKLEKRATKSRDIFRVSYGAEVHDNLNYKQAAEVFGCCVFHALACAGLMNDEDID